MNPLVKKVKIAHYGIPLILLLFTLASTVAAAAYIIYQFNISATVEEHPKVTFWKWSTSEKKNTFTYDVNIFPSIKTINENITHGIYCDDENSHTCSLRLNNVTNSGNIAKLNITIYNTTNTIFTKEWTSFSPLPETNWWPFTAAAHKKYAIQIEITASSGAVPSSSSIITIDMKVDNP